MNHREVMQQALEAIEDSGCKADLMAAADALRAALAEPQEPKQEPVAWEWLDTGHFRKKIPRQASPAYWRPLYLHPAPQRQPLTEYEAWEIWDALADRGKKGEDIVHAFAHAIERAHGIGGQDGQE